MADPIEKQAECLVSVWNAKGEQKNVAHFFCDVPKVGEFFQPIIQMAMRDGFVCVLIDVALPAPSTQNKEIFNVVHQDS